MFEHFPKTIQTSSFHSGRNLDETKVETILLKSSIRQREKVLSSRNFN